MQGQPSGKLLLDAAREAQELGFDSLWAGDSLLARPRHDPLTLLAAVAGAVPDVQIGTAVLLPALRNPVVLAQQLATIDQVSEGRLIVGAGIAADTPTVRAEFKAAGVPFEKRVGTLMEGFRLCKALWSGETVEWHGRWDVTQGVMAPEPFTKGGPPIWMAAHAPAGLKRTAQHFDGWFPIGPNVETVATQRETLLSHAHDAGRDATSLTTAAYLTVAAMEDAAAADVAINAYMENYYGAPAGVMRKIQSCFGGPLEDVLGFIRAYAVSGVEHITLRIVGDHRKTLRQIAAHRDQLQP
jgi:alkanesulfonate monooxygenase SsuD/methylene tetrahydromethanopterin reductase-like flavin-dependent oxidoreductase (luciferase family)